MTTHIPVAEAFGALLYPHAEVVIHDLGSDTIFHIVNSFSHRTVGEPSLFGDTAWLEAGETVLGPYEKANWNGERLKSITAILRDASGRPIGVLCVNLDVSKFDAALKLLGGFLAAEPDKRPKELFTFDWREQINLVLEAFLKDRAKVLEALTREDRTAFVEKLSNRNLFEARNAVSYVAAQLGVTRATIYNYLAARAPKQ